MTAPACAWTVHCGRKDQAVKNDHNLVSQGGQPGLSQPRKQDIGCERRVTEGVEQLAEIENSPG